MSFYIIFIILIIISSIFYFVYSSNSQASIPVQKKKRRIPPPEETSPEETSPEETPPEEIQLSASSMPSSQPPPPPSYKFYQGIDSGPYDTTRQINYTVEELKDLCNKDNNCQGFNSNGWFKWKIGQRTDWNRWSEDPDKGMYIKESVQILPLSNEWQCLTNIYTPLSLNDEGNVQCMSFNRKDCLWTNTSKECNSTINENKNKIPTPLVCGTMHKNKIGSTGYDDPKHWCSIGKNLLT